MSPDVRHRVMASIPKTDTRPELIIRAALRRAGLTGYRTHVRRLPGNPDVVYTRWRVAVFIDGVFWHGHPDYFTPGTKGPYWDKKIAGNVARDARVNVELEAEGWTVLRFWDKEVLSDPASVVAHVKHALRRRGRPMNCVSVESKAP